MAKKSDDVVQDPLERISRLLAIAISKDLEPEEAARRLLAAGFDAPTIGSLLGKNPNFANLAKHKAKKGKG